MIENKKTKKQSRLKFKKIYRIQKKVDLDLNFNEN
jgi:hypothetical protein